MDSFHQPSALSFDGNAFENKVKSCECWSVDDMVRDKFVFSGCEGTTVERRKAYIRESDLYGESV